MNYDIQNSTLEGFTQDYNQDTVRHLNDVLSRNIDELNYAGIIAAGVKADKNVKSYVKRSHPIASLKTPTDKNNEIYKFITFDNSQNAEKEEYMWLGRLDFDIGKAKVAILFPNYKCENKQISLERSVGIYTSEPVPQEDLKELTEKLAYNLTLLNPRKSGYEKISKSIMDVTRDYRAECKRAQELYEMMSEKKGVKAMKTILDERLLQIYPKKHSRKR
jgi:hypothetical protein